MSTVDPTGGGGGGGGTSTSVDDNATPGMLSTDIAVPPGSQHQQHPPPSPLSGCYLLVVLPEPHTAQHRDLILNRLAKGFLSWDKDSCHVDLEKELQALVAQAPEGEEARNGERLIQYATENLVTEVLIHPQTNTLLQCIRNLLASFTKHRHIIHAGYTFGGNGSWILQDGTFSLADFLDAFSEHEVQRVLRAYENSVTVDINCAGVGEWSTCRLSKEACTRSCRVRLNPDDVLTAGVPAIASFTNYVGQYLIPQTLDQLMEPSDVVGNIRFSHPTLYVFPGGQGDAALFGINGFNMLVDGGFARKACFWDFARHLDRLDAVLVTRVNNSNVGGMSSVLRKKREMHVYPQIGHFFCNLVERRHSNSPDGDKDLDPLTLNLIDIGQEMMVDLRQINLRAHPCYRDPNPINLYHKVGHGTLDMYVLSPSKDSREVREFLTKWNSADSKLFAGSHKKDSNNLTFPIQNLASICALLVWQPANPEDTITRILFPGSTPQHKIFEGIERLKHLEFLKHPVCSAKSLSPSTSLLALKDRPTIKQKMLIEKESKKAFETKKEKRDLPESKLSKAAAEDVSKPTPQSTPTIPISKPQAPKSDVKSKKVVENKKIETESKKMEKDLKEIKKEVIKKDVSKVDKDVEAKKLEAMKIKTDTEKTVPIKEPKARSEPKKKDTKDTRPGKVSKTEAPSKPAAKLPEKKPKSVDKKDSAKGSPPTPKKIMNGSATKAEVASKATPKPITRPAGKQPPASMPAKSAKDANNRKVVEQKNIEIASAASAAAPASAKLMAKPKTSERKPISRRTKPVSPSKARVPGSPAKSTRSTPTTSVKSDKDGVIRKVKGDRGTTDSSTVSTPSGIEVDSMTKLADKSLTEKSEDMSIDSIESKVLADLKEEREVVEEIEAVLQKAERIEEARKDDHLDGDDDITAEATDKKEDDVTEDDVTADIEEAPKKKTSRKASQELTEEDEYLIVEKEEIYIEDSAHSGEGEQKHVLDAVESEKVKPVEDTETAKEEEEAEISEEKEKSDIPEKKLLYRDEETDKEKEADEMLPGHKEQLKEEMKDIIASAAEIVQKTEDKDDSGKKDSEDITKEPSSLSPDKFDSSEKKTTDTDPMKPEVDQKDQQVVEKLEESQERISTLESGATTTAPTLPEDERIPLDDIKEVVDEKYVVDEEKDSVEQVKESFVAPIPVEPKPDAKSFQVRPAIQGIQREIVKTPDEVADLPVHEEVDPKLYRMEDFEKSKEEKPAVAPPAQPQEAKEPPTPPVKEQKGVFSFFGKVADKFEKGIDKLTGKSRRDSEKDIDEKSSSKSSSPKEAKIQEIALPTEVKVDEVKVAKVDVKVPEMPETFEKGEPEVSKVKVAAITDTAAFLQREIDDQTKSALPEPETKVTKDAVEAVVSEKPETKAESKPVVPSEPIFETCVLKGQQKDTLTDAVADVEDDAEDVEALLEEASKKFKTVKDSLRDSLESLEDKIVEEEMVRAELAAASKDIVKDTLSEVVEKLEEIKPHMEETSPADIKEPEKVKFDIPKMEDYEDEEPVMDVTKDLKEAVRDVGEVLAGSAGIVIEEKPKDVIEIVKKVAEELKKDDFLSHDALFDKTVPKLDGKVSDEETKPAKPVVEEIITKKVGVTEELPPQEEIEELLESGITAKPLTSPKPTGPEVQEEPCIKTITSTGIDVTSPIRDLPADKVDAKKICSDLMKEEPVSSRKKRSIFDEDEAKPDVMEAGIESVCVKEEVKRDDDREIQGTDIVFDRKLSPDKAQIVIVTPDSAPMSPKFPGFKVQAKEEVDETSQLPTEIKNELDKEGPLEKIIENLLFTKKTKITIEIVEYITVIRKIPREKVIYIIEEIIIKKGVPRDSVVADLDLLKPDTASDEKRAEIEQYIEQEYITKNKRITIDIVEEISIKQFVTKRIVIEIIEEIIVKKKIPRDAILDIPETEVSRLRGHRKESVTGVDAVPKPSQVIDEQVDEIPKTVDSEKSVRSEIEKYIVEEIISKGKKITLHIIDEISIAKRIPRRLFIEILEEVIIKRNIPRSSILDLSEKELSDLIMSEKDDMDQDEVLSEPEKEEPDEDSVSSQMRLQIEKNILDEYVTKNRRITPYIFEEICVQNKVPRRIIIQIIEEIVVKRKVPKSSILDISEIELEELLAAEKEEDEKESIAAASDDEDKKHVESETEEFEAVAPEKLSEIENIIIEEYISKFRRITPYIFEDICVRYKIPRRILIEIIEEVIVKRNIRRGSILDITDVELSELLAAAEEGDERDLDVGSEEDFAPEDVGEDHLVDGFVSIPGKEVAPIKASPPKTEVLAEKALKESVKDVADDFEAVEQEYKIHATPITTAKELTPVVPIAKPDEKKISDDAEEAIDDDINDVVEAEEKIIDVTAATAVTVAPTTTATDKKSEDVSETSEIVDTTEKYLIEAQEKAELPKISPERPSDTLVDDTDQAKLKDVQKSGAKSPVTEDKIDTTRVKRSIGEITPEPKDSLPVKEQVDAVPSSKVESPETKKMLDAIADGAQQTEVSPAESIITTIIPDDSLKTSPVAITDKDSLKLEKESLRSGASTPGKDSVSDKSTPETKDKLTPEDSVYKSPSVTHVSPDLKDSADKLEPTKVKETESPKTPTKVEQDAMPSKLSIDAEKDDEAVKAIIDEKASPVPTVLDDKSSTVPAECSRTPSVAGDAPSEKDLSVVDEKSRSPSVTSEKPSERSRSPSVAGDVISEKEAKDIQVAASKSPSITTERITEKDITDVQRDESKSPSIASEKHDDEKPTERSRSPSVVSEKITATHAKDVQLDRSKSPSIASEKPADRSRSSSIASEKIVEKDLSKSPSVISEKHDDMEPAERSRSPSITSEKMTEKVTSDIQKDGSKSPSVIGEKHDDVEPAERSRSPSIASEKMVEKDMTVIQKDGSKSPSVTSEKPADHSRSSSIASEKITEGTKDTQIDRSKSPSVTSEKHSAEEPADRSRSPSVASEQIVEKDLKDIHKDGSKSPSVTSEKPAAHSRSSSIASEKITDDIKDIQEDRSKSPSVISEKHDVKEPVDRSKSPSIASEQTDEKDVKDVQKDGSKSPSVTSEKHDDMEPAERSRSPSVTTEKMAEKDTSAIQKDGSKSPSVTSEKPADQSRSSSVASEKITEKDIKDVQIDRSKSPSVASEKHDVEEPTDRSRSPSVAGEQFVEKDVKDTEKDGSKSPSVTSEKPVDRSRSSSVVSEKITEKDVKDIQIDLSKSPSVTSEKHGVEESADRSRSPSVASEQIVEKDVKDTEKDGSKSPSATSEKPVDRSRSSSVVSEKITEKDVKDIQIDLSKSPSVTSEKHDDEEPADHSRSPSVAGEQFVEKDVKDTEKDGSKSPSVTSEKPVDRSRSSSIVSEKITEKDVKDIQIDQSKSPSVTSEKHDVEESADRSRSPSATSEQIVQKDVKDTEKDGSKSPSVTSEKPTDRSRSSSVVSEKMTEKDLKDIQIDLSKSPSVTSEKHGVEEPADRSRSSSVASEQIVEKDVKDIGKDGSKSPSVTSEKPVDRSRSSSVVSEKIVEKDIKDIQKDGSKSPSVTSEKHDVDEPVDRSRSPSVASEQIVEKDVKDTDKDGSKSPSVTSEKPTDRSRSSSVVSEKIIEKDVKDIQIDGSKSPCVTSEKLDVDEPVDRSRSPSVASEQIVEKDVKDIEKDGSKSPSVTSEKPAERSRSSSVVSEKITEKDVKDVQIDGSKSPSVTSEKHDDREIVERTRSPSVASDKISEKDLRDIEADEYKTPSVPCEMIDEKAAIHDLETRSIPDDKLIEKDVSDVDEKSRSPSIASEKHDDKKPSEDTKTPTITLDTVKPTEPGKVTPDELIKDSTVKIIPDQESLHSDKELLRSGASTPEKDSVSGKSTPETKDSDKLITDDTCDKSEPTKLTQMEKLKSPTKMEQDILPVKLGSAAEKSDVTIDAIADKKELHLDKMSDDKLSIASAERSRTPSVVGDALSEKDISEVDEKSRSLSVTSEKPSELADRSRSPSVIDHKIGETELKDIQLDQSKSSIAPSEKIDEKTQKVASEVIEKSRSPSIASEKDDAKQPSESTRKPSISLDSVKPADIKVTLDALKTSPVKTTPDQVTSQLDKESLRSGTSTPENDSVSGKSSPGMKDGDKLTPEDPPLKDSFHKSEPTKPTETEKSKPPIEMKETIPSKLSIAVTKSDEIVKAIIDEKESHAPTMLDDKSSIVSSERSRTPSVAGDAPSEKDVSAVDEKSRSPSVTSEKPSETAERSRSPSVAGDKIAEKDLKEIQSDMAKSPTAPSEKIDEKVTSEVDEKSRSPSIIGEKHDTMSIVTVESSRAPSVAGDRLSEKDASEVDEKSRSPSVASEKPSERSRSPSIVDEKITDKDLKATQILESLLPSAPSAKIDEKAEKEAPEIAEKSRSPSLASEKSDTKEPTESIKTPSVVLDHKKITDAVKVTPDDSLKISPIKTTSDQDSLVLDKESLRSGASTPEKESVSGKSTPGTKAGDKLTPEDSLDKSPSVIGDLQDRKDSLDKADPIKLKEGETPKFPTKIEQDVLPSISSFATEKIGETAKAIIDEEKSHTPTISDDKSTIAPTERSRTPSVAGSVPSEKDVSVEDEKSRSPSISSEKQDDKQPTIDTRSSSISLDIVKPIDSGKATPEDSVKSSPVKTTIDQDSLHLDKESLRSGASTPGRDSISGKSTPGTKDGDKLTPEDTSDKSPSVIEDSPALKGSLDKSEPIKLPESEKPEFPTKVEPKVMLSKLDSAIEKTAVTSEAIIQEKISDHLTTLDKSSIVLEEGSKKPSVAGDGLSEKAVSEMDEKFRSVSVTSEKPSEPIESSRSSSIGGDKIADMKDVQIDQSKPPSVPSGKIEEKAEKDAPKVAEKLRSPSIVSEKIDTSELTEVTKPPSVTVDHAKPVEQDSAPDKLIDGSASISGKDVTPIKDISLSKTGELAEQLSKESDKDVTDEFEVVEQEYKIHATPITTAKVSIPIVPDVKPDEKKISDDAEVAFDDNTTEIVEAVEKTVGVVAPTTETATATEKKPEKTPDLSGSVTITEKYPIEAPKEDHSQLHTPVKPSDTLVDDKDEAKPKQEQDIEISKSTLEKDTTGGRDPAVVQDDHKESKIFPQEELTTMQTIKETTQPQKDAEIDVATHKPSTVELKEQKESGSKSPVTEDKIDTTRVKRSVDDVTLQQKDSAIIQDLVEPVSKSGAESPDRKKISSEITDTEDTPIGSSTVHRMLVTASSEDGGQETEVCPTESLTTTITPDDSLKTSPVKTTPDQDSLLLDKESLRSGAGTPEKDSLSGKSTPGTKDDDKITPEDSLDKSPSGIRDSQDLEDSLEKSVSIKLTESEKPKSLSETAEDVRPSKLDIAVEKSEQTVEATVPEAKPDLYMRTDKSPLASAESVRTPSIASDKLSEKDASEVDEKSRSPSVTSEKPDDAKLVEHSKSPSIAGDVIDETDLKGVQADVAKSSSVPSEKVDEKADVDQSITRSSTGDKLTARDASEVDEKSRSPSIVSEKLDTKQSSESAKTPSISPDHEELTDSGKTIAPPASERMSGSPSIPTDTVQKDEHKKDIDRELIDESRPISISSVHDSKLDGKDAVQALQKLAETIADKSAEVKQVTKSPHDEIEQHETPKDRSRSHSVFDAGEKTPLDRSRTASLFDDRVPESLRGEVELAVQEPGSTDKYDESDKTKPTKDDPLRKSSLKDGPVEKEYSASSDSEKTRPAKIEDPSWERSRQLAEDYITNEYIIKKKPITSLVVEEIETLYSMPKYMILELIEVIIVKKNVPRDFVVDYPKYEETCDSAITKPRSPSITSEKPGDVQRIDHSRSPSVVGDKIDEKDFKDAQTDVAKSPSAISEKIDETATVDQSVTRSDTGDKLSEKDSSEVEEKSRSPSIASEKLGTKQPSESAKTPSLSSDHKELTDPDKTTAPPDSERTSRSPSIPTDTVQSDDDKKHIDQDLTDKSRSTSIASVHDSKLDGKDAVQALQKLAETIADKSAEVKHVTKSPHDDIEQHETPKDRSRSHSVFDTGEKTPLGRSRTASLFDDRVPESLRGASKPAPQEPGGTYSYDESDEMRKDFLDKEAASWERSRKLAEDYITNEYIIKKKPITSLVVEEIETLYPMPNYMILELIENIIVKKNVPRDFVVDCPKYDEGTKRYEIQRYILKEYVKRGIKITMLVLEEIRERFSISMPVLLNLLGNVVEWSLKERSTVVDDAVWNQIGIYWEETVPEDEPIAPETDTRSGYSTPDSWDDDEKYVRAVSMYANGYESSADRAFLRRTTKIRTTHITTLSGKSTPDIGARETPESLSESIMSSSQMKTEEKMPSDKESLHTSAKEYSQTVELAPSISTVGVTMATGSTTVSTVDSVPDQKRDGVSVPSEKLTGAETLSEHPSKTVKRDSIDVESKSQLGDTSDMTKIEPRAKLEEEQQQTITTTTVIRKEVISDDEPEIITRIVRREVMGDEEPEIITRVIRREIVDEDEQEKEPEVITRVIRREIVGEEEQEKEPEVITRVIRREIVGEEEQEEEPEVITRVIRREIVDEDEQEKEPEVITRVIRREIVGEEEQEKEPEVITRVIRREIVDEDEQEKEPEVITRVIGREIVDEDEQEKEPEVITRVIRREIVDEDEQENEPEVITRVIRREIVNEDEQEKEPEVITRVIRREIVDEDEQEKEPEVITRVIRREIVDEEGQEKEPEIITRVIRREIVDDDIADDYHHRATTQRTSTQEESSDVIETIVTRTTKSIVKGDMPHYEKSELQVMPEKITIVASPISADVRRTITTVTTVTDPDGKVTTKKDVQESTDTLEGDELLEKLIDSTKTDDSEALTDAKSIECLKTEKIITETIKTVASGSDSSAPGSTADSASRDEKCDTLSKSTLEKIVAETVDHPISPIIKDLISDQRSYSGKSSPDISLGKDTQLDGSKGKSTLDTSVSPITKEGGAAVGTLGQTSGRSTPDRRSDGRSRTATPEGFRSSEVIRTTITTTRTMSEDGDIITTTREVTESTNEKGEVTILNEKTDVKVEDKAYSKDIGESSPKSDHSSMHSRAGTHAWESSEERPAYSDDEAPGSPLSTTSQVGYSPQSTYHFGVQGFGKDSSHKSIEFSEADMSSSFYGELPDLPPRVTTLKTPYLESSGSETSGASAPAPTEGDFSFKKFTVEKEFAGGYSEKSGGKRYVDDADLDFEKALMERKEMKRDRGGLSTAAATGYTNGSLAKPSSSSKDTKDPKDDAKRDPLADWGTPLGLPSPKPPRKFNLRTTARPTNSADISPDSLNFDAINDWGEPLRLPSPAPLADEGSNKGTPVTPKKERKQPKKVISENIKNKKRSESPSKNEKKTKDAKNKVQPVYMDLTYVPHHGNSYYTSLEFFKRVRARYYVFSGTEPSREVYDALLDAKKTWEDKDLEVTMIPTYDTDTLGYWVADNEEALATNHIDLSPSASRCTINLQDHETSCSAYRLEF